MPEVLRDLVVSLSLKTDNFSRNINSINRQIREAESAFRLAGAGIDNFGNTTAGMSSRLSMLQTNLGHQRDAVSQYERALATANTRLQESYTRYQQYSQRLTEARQRHTELAEGIRNHENELRALKDEGYENTIAYAEAESRLDGLRQEYAANGEEVRKLEGQCNALQKTMQRNADTVSRAKTDLNNARAAVRETEAEIRKLSQQLKIQQSAWTQAGAALTAFSTKMTAIGKSATALGRRMTVMLTTPIVALGKKVVQASLDFESSFAYVRKTVQATEEQYDQLAAASKRMSTQIATSTSDINHVMATGGQLGIATEHIEEFSRVMIDLANSSTDLDADTAATNLAKFANIMNTDQSLFKNIGSTVAELGNNFATTEEPIVTMAMRIAGAGKQIGLTEPQVLGLAAALSSVGIQAQAGGSSMSKALINMEVAAKTGGNALKDFAMVSGLTEKEFVEQWENDPVQVFQKFIEGLGKMDDEGASAVKTLNDIGISEIRLRDTLLRATNASELFARAQEMANDAWKENTALDTMAVKKYATLASRLTNLKNKAVLYAQTLGDDMRPSIERVMESIGQFIDRLQNMDQSQRLGIIRFAALTAAAGPVILIFGRLATGIGKVSGWLGTFCTAVGKAGGGVSGLLTVLAKSPAVWLAVGAAVVYGVAKLYDWVSGAKMAREATQALIDKAKESHEKHNNLTRPTRIIMVMNEAFSDLRGVGLDSRIDVMPFIDSLEDNTVEGNLYVSVFGGGTCNTEFEALTGNTLAFLGVSAYPYTENVTKPLFSLASYFKENGYTAEASHPNEANNWNRNVAYPNLGFEKFHSIEDFNERDEVILLHELPADINDYHMIEAIDKENADKPRFLFDVTMQNHSPYERWLDVEKAESVVENGSNLYVDTQVYLSLVKASDDQIRQLVETYRNNDEPTMIIFFGDHQPGLPNTAMNEIYTDIRSNLDFYKTRFFIWTNYKTNEWHNAGISANYLPWLILDQGNFPLPPYVQMLKELYEHYPIISAQGVMDINGNIYTGVAEVMDNPLIQKYQYIQYANLFDEIDPAWFEVK